jgi:hypothetical protein
VEASGVTRARRGGLAGVTRLARRAATRTFVATHSRLCLGSDSPEDGSRRTSWHAIGGRTFRRYQLRATCSAPPRMFSMAATGFPATPKRAGVLVHGRACRSLTFHVAGGRHSSRSTSRSSAGFVASAQGARHDPSRPGAESPCSHVGDGDRSLRNAFRRTRRAVLLDRRARAIRPGLRRSAGTLRGCRASLLVFRERHRG